MTEPARDAAGAELRNYTFLLITIVVVALLLRLPNFNESLWHDELWSTFLKLDSVRGLLYEIATDTHPPFYNVVMFVWVRLFGDSEISVRMLPLICGLLTIGLVARLASEYESPRAGLAAAFVLAISPPHIWYSQEARQYAPMLLMLTACTLAFRRLRDTHATKWFGMYAALAFSMVLTHYFALAYVAAFTLLAMPDARIRRRVLWTFALITAVIGAYIAVRWRFHTLPISLGHLRGFGLLTAWQLMFDWYVIGNALGFPGRRAVGLQLGIVAMQLVLFALVARGILRAGEVNGSAASSGSRWDMLARRWEFATLLLILPVALLTLGLVGPKRFYIERSAITVLPFFAVAVGIGATSFRSRVWRVLSVALIAAFGSVVLVSYYAKSDKRTVYIPNPDWRAAARWLREQHTLSGHPIVVISPTSAIELLYYDRDFQLTDAPRGLTTRLFLRAGENPTTLRDRLKQRFSPPEDTTRGKAAHVYMLPTPEVVKVKSVLEREHASEFFVVVNLYIVRKDRLREAIAANPSFVIESVYEAKGLRLLKVRLFDSNAQEATAVQ